MEEVKRFLKHISFLEGLGGKAVLGGKAFILFLPLLFAACSSDESAESTNGAKKPHSRESSIMAMALSLPQ